MRRQEKESLLSSALLKPATPSGRPHLEGTDRQAFLRSSDFAGVEECPGSIVASRPGLPSHGGDVKLCPLRGLPGAWSKDVKKARLLRIAGRFAGAARERERDFRASFLPASSCPSSSVPPRLWPSLWCGCHDPDLPPPWPLRRPLPLRPVCSPEHLSQPWTLLRSSLASLWLLWCHLRGPFLSRLRSFLSLVLSSPRPVSPTHPPSQRLGVCCALDPAGLLGCVLSFCPAHCHWQRSFSAAPPQQPPPSPPAGAEPQAAGLLPGWP